MQERIHRDTKQRAAIKNALEKAGRPLGPKEVLALAAAEVPNLGIATVYRNIKAMVGRGELQAVDLPGRAPRYQLPSRPASHLFICEKTDRVFPVEVKENGGKPQLPKGFRADRFQVFYYGTSKPRRDRRARK